jgi:hypothetical protein
MPGMYEFDGKRFYGDGREVYPSPPSTEEFRDECLERVRAIKDAYAKTR